MLIADAFPNPDVARTGVFTGTVVVWLFVCIKSACCPLQAGRGAQSSWGTACQHVGHNFSGPRLGDGRRLGAGAAGSTACGTAGSAHAHVTCTALWECVVAIPTLLWEYVWPRLPLPPFGSGRPGTSLGPSRRGAAYRLGAALRVGAYFFCWHCGTIQGAFQFVPVRGPPHHGRVPHQRAQKGVSENI